MKDFFKLNRGGWGLKEMVIIVAILLSFLLVAGYYIFVLSKDLGYDDAAIYNELETKLKTSAVSYIHKNDLEDKDIIVSLSDLKAGGYLEHFIDNNSDTCNGYVVYKNYDYESYISCKLYKTNDYNSLYE